MEYKETKKVREFVIAIDTSGSVSGDLVQSFVQKTYNILKSTESFASKVNIHIIQCDQEIREDVKVTNQEDFDAYLAHMTLKGFGGTDFRPVFGYVEELRKRRNSGTSRASFILPTVWAFTRSGSQTMILPSSS